MPSSNEPSFRSHRNWETLGVIGHKGYYSVLHNTYEVSWRRLVKTKTITFNIYIEDSLHYTCKGPLHIDQKALITVGGTQKRRVSKSTIQKTVLQQSDL